MGGQSRALEEYVIKGKQLSHEEKQEHNSRIFCDSIEACLGRLWWDNVRNE